MAMDLANYLNETMLDNAYQEKNGIAWYIENCLTRAELEEMSKKYMECYFNKYMKSEVKSKFSSVDDFIQKELSQLIKEIYQCAKLNNFFWGVWCLQLLKPDEYAKDGIFNYDFAKSRVEMYKKVCEIDKWNEFS